MEQGTNKDFIEHKWKPGESGNPKGRPPDSVTTLLKNKDRKAVADKLYELAIAGDMRAIDVYLDRTEGKVVDKRLSLTLTAILSPELLEEAQKRLQGSQEETMKLLKEFEDAV